MLKILMGLWTDESGQGMAEYGLILALVAVVAIVGFTYLGGKINDKVNSVGDSLK